MATDSVVSSREEQSVSDLAKVVQLEGKDQTVDRMRDTNEIVAKTELLGGEDTVNLLSELNEDELNIKVQEQSLGRMTSNSYN